MRLRHFLIYGLLSISFFSCKDAYRPDIISTEQSYLVVEGVLRVGGPASVTLTRSAKLYTNGFTTVNTAQVTVEGKDNTTRPMLHTVNGVYTSANLNLILGNEYRLKIRTNDGKEYLSEYVVAKSTPAIDSVGWKREDDGVRVYVNTDDPSGNTRYYRWDYDETWEITSYYYSRYIYLGGFNIRERIMPQEEVYTCWKNDKSKNILLGSSARLQSDVIFQAPVNFIENNSEKLAVRYSIFVRQYALDKKAYDFYELMKRNTESLGTIFDAQPSESRGNIQCVSDPSELVIGYITSSTVTEKRFFISKTELGGWQFYQDCPSLDIKNDPDSIALAFGTGGLAPIDANFDLIIPNKIVSWWSSKPVCVDCTKRGGSTVRPSFW